MDLWHLPAFNGATAFRRWKPSFDTGTLRYRLTLQWGHRLSAMENWENFRQCPFGILQPSMGPPPFGDGNWRAILAIGNHATGEPPFNGATAFRRWKLMTRLRDDSSWIQPPSMGPPPFGDGKPSPAEHSSGLQGNLQWGHRLSAMETIVARPLITAGDSTSSADLIPSMGPPPFGDGNYRMPSRRRVHASVLQWGHRLSAMETGRSHASPIRSINAFNGATAFRRWKPG